MKLDRKLAVCAVLSIVTHFAIARALDLLPEQEKRDEPRKIDIRVVPAPPVEPPPEPEKPPEPVPPPPQETHEAPKPRAVKAPTVAPVAKDAPPPDHPAVVTNDTTTETPVFGVNLESTSSVGKGPAMPTGNTTKAEPGPGSASAKTLAAPIAAFEATKMPLPQGRCFGKYTDEARAAGIEGTVVLDLIVGEDGRVRDVQVVSGLANGLTEAAVAALRDCRFSPGEKDGKAVPVRVRGFKIRFVLAEAN
jgi:protein TonB